MIRLCAISSVVVVVILGVARAVSAGPLLELDGTGLLVCAGINLGVCWLAFVPIAVVSRSRRYHSFLPQAILGGTTIRLLVVAPATMALIKWGPWPMMPLTIWMVMFYLSLLAVETALAVRLLNRGTKTMQGCTAA